MRFSLGPRTREETEGVLQKFLSWEHAGSPSPFAVISRKRDKLIGYRLDPDYWNRGLASEAAQAVRGHAFRDLRFTQGHFADSSRQCRFAPRG